jgi:hypothetical protein
MLERTDTEWGPWTIVEATDQFYTLWRVLSTLTEALDAGLQRRGVDTDALSAEAMAASAASRAQTSQPASLESVEENALEGDAEPEAAVYGEHDSAS